MDKVKILRITTVSHSVNFLLKGQLKYIGEQNFDVSVAFSECDDIKEIIERENVTYFKLNITRTINPFKDVIGLYHAIRIIRRINPDIVHTHSPKAGIIGMMAAWLCKTPLKIHTVAGLPLVETTGLKKRILIIVERFTYFFADYVLPNSVRQKEFINRYILDDSTKIKVIGKGSSNGIDLQYFNPQLFSADSNSDFRKRLNISAGDLVMCFVGRLTNYKGVNELVSAFNFLCGQYNNIKLLLVGPHEDLNPLTEDTLESIRTHEKIISVGQQSDIRPFLAISDIFVFPSYREGFPQSLMQAAAMNLACVATDINGCNEILSDGVTGLLIPPKNVDELVLACRRLIENPELRLKLSESARREMELHFEQKLFWQKLVTFYRDNLFNKLT